MAATTFLLLVATSAGFLLATGAMAWLLWYRESVATAVALAPVVVATWTALWTVRDPTPLTALHAFLLADVAVLVLPVVVLARLLGGTPSSRVAERSSSSGGDDGGPGVAGPADPPRPAPGAPGWPGRPVGPTRRRQARPSRPGRRDGSSAPQCPHAPVPRRPVRTQPHG